jgi:hypothetical protein
MASQTVPIYSPALLALTLSQLDNFSPWPMLYSLGKDRIENTASNSSSTVVCVSVEVDTCLFGCCLAMAVYSGSTIPFCQMSHHTDPYLSWSSQVAHQHITSTISSSSRAHACGIHCRPHKWHFTIVLWLTLLPVHWDRTFKTAPCSYSAGP